MTRAGVLKSLRFRTVSLLTVLAVLLSTCLAPALHAQNSDAQKPVKDKWAVVIGISKFKDGKINLRYPSKDAEDFCRYLTEEAGFAKD
ncbi:MAG TPA: caspase family protein, partial [Candidatus Melainabacteria bacterium]|nr:caspase family protein [Candidatus Melainabacteria bacterium]